LIIPNPEDNSCFPKAARAAGMSYDDLLLTILDEACRRLQLMPAPQVANSKKRLMEEVVLS
jgi:D-alanine-D-alanine ligase